MTPAVALGVVVTLTFFIGLLAQAGCLWLGGRAVRAVRATFRRALLLAVLLTVLEFALFPLQFVANAYLPPPADSLVFIGLSVAVAAICVARVFGTSILRGAGAWLLSTVLGLAAGAAIVFGLKTYLLEAYVVTAGSMAEAILGAHKTFECPQCGLRFPVNASSEAVDVSGRPPLFVTGCTCPQCRYVIDGRRVGSTLPPVEGGDRLAVLKGLLFDPVRDLSRFDVVVLRPPLADPQGGQPEPYVKRLAGLPGETIAIHAGRLYRLKDLAHVDRPKGVAVDDDALRERFEKGEFEILRKPPDVMLALRRLVYDGDNPARDLAGEQWERWRGEGWSSIGGRFAHAGGSGDTDWLRYRHLLRENHGKPQLITDFMGYNTAAFPVDFFPRDPGANWVGDLMLECEAAVEKPEGTLTLELSHGVDRFQARFDVATGGCKLVRISGLAERELAAAPTELKKPGTYRLRFADFDDRLTVWVDNVLSFGDGVVYAPPKDEGPTKENDLERPASVGARGSAVRVDHLQLWRNTYYTVGRISPLDPDVRVRDFADPDEWEEFKQLPVRTFTVGPGNYFFLGDNSPESADSRVWGTVPAPLLLGKAVFVYYPFRRAGWLR